MSQKTSEDLNRYELENSPISKLHYELLREAQAGGCICILIADLCCCMGETNTTV